MATTKILYLSEYVFETPYSREQIEQIIEDGLEAEASLIAFERVNPESSFLLRVKHRDDITFLP